jgi:hypothetical protein
MGMEHERHLELLKWKTGREKKPVQIKMHFMFKIFQRNRLPESTFHKLVLGFHWSV